LNPTEHQYGHSPYNAISGLAGNPLLISPELLAEEGLLDAAVLSDHKTVTEERADYERAVRIRQQLLPQAWRRFLEGDFSSLKKSYRYFCETEAHWLDDYALYMVIRHQQGNTPWHQWPAPLRLRNQPALARLAAAHKVEIDEIKWQQFMFFRQWKALRNYCHNAGIKLFGDLPFYVSYDAADVWANPEIFRLDSSGGIAGMAGVPPDYFCSDGQLWGMPTFNWVTLQKRNYDWWITRLRKNLELYDLLRLDHFRAFAAYWEVPGGSLTARTGKWIAGPGAVFFRAVETALGSLPFVAEDLGEDMDDVYRLRDTLGLPGMKVLQFAFGDNMPASVDALHHHTPQSIAYTGTHDNNTTVGWYQEDLTDTDRQRIAAYTAARPTARQIHLILSRIAYASVARIAILPAQDLLGLESIHRMNRPGQSKNNWLWRLLPSQLDLGVEKRLQDWVYLYNR
jgi:4-alpha-glucanotransferase